MKKLLLLALTLFAATASSRAAALTAERDTPVRDGAYLSLTQGSNTIYAGSMVALDSSGVALPAADASGYIVVGRAERTSANVGADYSATKTITVRRGVFRWANGSSLAAADIGDLAYVSDDQTVASPTGLTHDVVAGLIVDVDASGVWVDCLSVGGQGAASVAALTATGAANLQSTLAVTGNTTIGGTLGVTGAATFSSTLGVTGNATVPALIVLGSTTGTLDIAETGDGTNSLVLIIGTTTNIVAENVQ